MCTDFETWHEDRYYSTLHFDSSHGDLNLDSRLQGCQKANFCAKYLTSFLMDLDGMLLRPASLMNLIFVYLSWSVFTEDNSANAISQEKL